MSIEYGHLPDVPSLFILIFSIFLLVSVSDGELVKVTQTVSKVSFFLQYRKMQLIPLKNFNIKTFLVFR